MAYVMEFADYIDMTYYNDYIDIDDNIVISLELKNCSYDENGKKNFMGKHLVIKSNNVPVYTIEMCKKNREFKFDIYSCEKKFKFIPAKRILETDLDNLSDVKEVVCGIINQDYSMTFEEAIKNVFDGNIKLTRNGMSIR